MTVADGRRTIGFVLDRGRDGFEALDHAERSLGNHGDQDKPNKRPSLKEIKAKHHEIAVRYRNSKPPKGTFARWQPEYAARRIATFPVGETKRPKIRGWQKVGLRGSGELAAKFKDADALGYLTGRRSNVTVVDVDTTDEKILADALQRHGQAAIITRTASGKFHALYRYNGEQRRIRPWPELPIDVLGDNGFVIAPPSKLAKGSYKIIHGHLDDLDRLGPMAGAPVAKPMATAPVAPSAPSADAPLRGMREHDGRNNALFLAIGPLARKIHQACGRRDELLSVAQKLNAQCAQPMEGKEVSNIVDSVWGLTLEGRNVIGMSDAFCLMVDDLEIEDLSAFKLLAFLRAHQGPHATFVCTNSLGPKRLGWDERRVANARRTLTELGYLVPVRQAGRGHAALFRWGKY